MALPDEKSYGRKALAWRVYLYSGLAILLALLLTRGTFQRGIVILVSLIAIISLSILRPRQRIDRHKKAEDLLNRTLTRHAVSGLS